MADADIRLSHPPYYRFICDRENKKRDKSGVEEAFDHAYEDDLTDIKNKQFRCKFCCTHFSRTFARYRSGQADKTTQTPSRNGVIVDVIRSFLNAVSSAQASRNRARK